MEAYFFQVDILFSKENQRPRNELQTPKMEPKWSPQLPLTNMNAFQGSLTHLGVLGGHQSQIWAISGADFDLPWFPPSRPVNFLRSKMASAGVPHIVRQLLCSTRTYWGHVRPSKVSFSSIAERSSLLLQQYEFRKYCF